MDPQIKRRLKFDITVYPCIGKIDGDSSFGTPIVIKGYEVSKIGTAIKKGGETVNVTSAIYISGEDLDKIHNEDEVLSIIAGRLPVQFIAPYPSLGAGYELVVIYL